MDNRNNNLFNEIIDMPNNVTNDNPYNQQHNSVGTSSVTNTVPNQTQTERSNIQPNVRDFGFEGNNNQSTNINYDNNPSNTTSPSVSLQEPEIIDFDFESQPEEINVQGKVVDHELLQNLNKDTNNLVNPNMIINPLGKPEQPSFSVNIEEPKVDYDEIKTKKGYVFMAIIFLIVILFIIFLPQIMSFIGI